ncbi:MAG TPA: hypothetical protein VLJ39_20595, partial [Tepidisphaeraceae bacterium]|nr:hypothetical protein [Tepidisphaeraceae bacterium]
RVRPVAPEHGHQRHPPQSGLSNFIAGGWRRPYSTVVTRQLIERMSICTLECHLPSDPERPRVPEDLACHVDY